MQYVNRFFITQRGDAFALFHILESAERYADSEPYHYEKGTLFESPDGFALWNWSGTLLWTYEQCVAWVRDYDDTAGRIGDTRTELLDLRFGVARLVTGWSYAERAR